MNRSGGWIAESLKLVRASLLALFLVFHCLSLDAVGVLLVYQWCLASWASIELPGLAFLCMGMGIWLGYTADRLKDVSPKRQTLASTLRHHFHREHRRALRLAWILVLLGALALGWFWLPRMAFLTGLSFAFGAAVYVITVPRQKRSSREGPRLLKRFVVALLLALSGLWWWLGWGEGSWPEPKLFILGGLFMILAFWELILLEGRRIHRGSFASFWINGGAALALAAIGWPLGLAPYASLLWAILGFSFLTQTGLNWPGEMKSLVGDGLILSQFLLLAFLA